MTVSEDGETAATGDGPSAASPPVAALEPAAGDGEDVERFAIDVPSFHGPLELLHHLIERRELDITEISLLAVTEQYLAYLREPEQIDLTALADFVAVGARLLLLKSRALLPHEEEIDDAEDEADPQGLIDALNEYRRFKQAAEFLGARDRAGQRSYTRSATPPEIPLPTGLDTVSVDALADLFREVLARIPEQEPAGEVERQTVTLSDRIGRLVETLERDGQLSFRELMGGATSRVVVIVDFLAVLELIKAGYLRAQQAQAFGDIDLVHVEGVAAPEAASMTGDFAGA